MIGDLAGWARDLVVAAGYIGVFLAMPRVADVAMRDPGFLLRFVAIVGVVDGVLLVVLAFAPNVAVAVAMHALLAASIVIGVVSLQRAATTDQGRRAITRRATLQQGQRVTNRTRCQHLFHGQWIAILCIGIMLTVCASLDGDLRQNFWPQIALMQVPTSTHAIHRRHHQALLDLGILLYQRQGASAKLRQLVHTDHQHDVVSASLDIFPRQVNGRGPTRAGVIAIDDRHCTNTDFLDQTLPRQHATKGVAANNSINILSLYTGTGHRVKDCWQGQTGIAGSR